MDKYILIIIHFKDGTVTEQRINKDEGMLHFNAIPALAANNPILYFGVYADGPNWKTAHNSKHAQVST